ncbi:phosphoesterase family-domain-containing protein [Multifurca ochricompacta]|uniref:Phosphoesterase family-domain-containing protein n=1 Tax=Multifurca ochricompacta TaxID=376703 RepID=A0AAD4QRE3_9AGAM|nr:phosphoesterase family-domain-containing protein [Multifurca ochricompacta]
MKFSVLYLLLLPVAVVPTFVPPSLGPTEQKVHGKSFDRFIQIWLENTDFETANATAEFQKLASQGILLDQYFALTHPSEPNYVAGVAGDFWGMANDGFFAIPSNISTIVDLLDTKDISWASYQENAPADGFTGFSFASVNYLSPGAPPRTFYVRKHNPLIIYDSVATVPSRAARIRNFNDFAADVNASAIPQWLFVTPNLVNDGHDTDMTFTSAWLEFWLEPLLTDRRFNDEHTLILLTFDENETKGTNNRIWAALLGGAIPKHLHGTTDSTFYTHYSALSTVQANWGLGSLGRFDTDKILANVYAPVADAVGFKNTDVPPSAVPLLNQSGTTPGPLNPNPALFAPFPPPDTSAVGAGGGPVFVPSGN